MLNARLWFLLIHKKCKNLPSLLFSAWNILSYVALHTSRNSWIHCFKIASTLCFYTTLFLMIKQLLSALSPYVNQNWKSDLKHWPFESKIHQFLESKRKSLGYKSVLEAIRNSNEIFNTTTEWSIWLVDTQSNNINFTIKMRVLIVNIP